VNIVENLKRVLAYHMSRLDDKSVEVRIKAIKELELLACGEESMQNDVLEALKVVYKDDADSEVRRAAQEAGRVIFRVWSK
jgi:hypothetical protein